MARILVVGLAALDIISRVDGYPAEDSEVRALDQRWCRGGNGANTAAVLAQLGHQCAFAGTLADEPNGRWILRDLQGYGIDTGACRWIANGKTPVSCITVNACSGSRSIVHYRDLPEFSYQDFAAIDLQIYDWVHFEGRNIGETLAMMARAKSEHPGTRLSVEIEKPRPEDECQLFDAADVLLFSRPYVRYRGFSDSQAFLAAMRRSAPRAILICSWAASGAYGLSADNRICASPAFPPSRVVDTVGAGDTFNAAIIHALERNQDLGSALETACRLAGKKCGQLGFDGLDGEWVA